MPRTIAGFARIFCIFTSLSAAAKTYEVDGLVVSLDPAKSAFTISHRPIPGFMPAMTMPFRVSRAADLAGLQPGNRVRFQMRIEAGSPEARKIRLLSPADPEIPVVKRPVPGEPLPDFLLMDQAGTKRRLSELRGRVVAVNFIYTRCPLPDVCPRLGANFAAVQRRFSGRLGRDLHLLSITIDPVHDTPAVLAEYAKMWRADPAGWWFLTGTGGQISKTASDFGLVYWPEDGSIAHSVVTAILDREGRLAALIEGTNHRAAQIGDVIAKQLEMQ